MSNPNGGPAPTTIQDATFPRQSAWQIGTIRLQGQTVPVKVHYLLPLYWVFSLIMGIFRGGIYFGYLIVTDVLILFLTVFVHEIGHSLAALRYSGTCHAITLWPLGGFAEVSHDKGPKEDLWVSFAGPLTHVPMGLMWYGIVAAVVRGPFNIMYGVPCDLRDASCFWTDVCASAGFTNLLLLLFNLFIPAYPLDACRILVDFFALCRVEVNRAANITVWISVPIGLALMGYGFYELAHGGPNSFMFIFLAGFMLYSTWGVYKAAKAGMAARHPMFTHYYRTSENETTNSSVSSSAPSNFTSFSAFAARQPQQPQGGGGQALGGGSTTSNAAVSNMEAGKGYRLGGSSTAGGHVLGGSAAGAGGRPGGPPARGQQPPGRAGSGASLLGGSASGSTSGSNAGAGGKGYRLGSK